MTHQVNSATRDLLSFLSENYEGVQNAAFLLGGTQALKRVQNILETLAGTRVLTRKVRYDLVALHQLFSLKHVGDPNRIETVLFAEIDPTDPIIEDICLLTDALEDHLRAIDAASDLPVFDFEMAA